MPSTQFIVIVIILNRCTILHRCDDEAGCCDSSSMRCMPIRQQVIELYFYSLQSNNTSIVEMLTFVNHTQCECQEVNYMPRNKAVTDNGNRQLTESHSSKKSDFSRDQTPSSLSSSTTTASTVSTTTSLSHYGSHHHQSQNPYPTQSESHIAQTQYCKWVECPVPFTARLQRSDQRCICDCFADDRECLRVKQGKTKLSPGEIRCVQKGTCLEPLCDAGGSYSVHEGKCKFPKHHSRIHHKYRHHIRHNKHYLEERD